MLPSALCDLAASWGSYYSNHAVLRTLVAFVHIGGLVVGGGAAMVADRSVLTAVTRGAAERESLLTSVRNTHSVVLAGLVAIIISGVLLLAADLDTYLVSRLFWAKMALVVLLMINGLALTAAERRAATGHDSSWRTLRWTAIASLALWCLTTLTGTGLLNIG
jgi:uncharacterized membrane protein